MSRRVRGAALVGALATLSSTTGCQDPAPSSHPLEQSTAPTSVSPTTSVGAGPASCPRPGGWTLDDPRITESSGLARSHTFPGVLYTHNDQGGLPHLFAVDASGTRAVLRLDVATVDWEDVASTPDGRIWVGDIGDNARARESIQVTVVEEPAELVSESVPSETYELRYPDGPHDAEALLVDPRDDRIYLVTKEPEEGDVYAAPVELRTGGSNLLEHVGEAPLNITGGAFSPDGELVVLRNQGRAFFYSELGGDPTEVTLPEQPQGESVAFAADSRHVLVGSEGVNSVIRCVTIPREVGE